VSTFEASAWATSPAALLLDMDGTLVQSEDIWGDAERAVMAEFGIEWTDEDRAHVLGGPLERVVAYMIGKSAGEHDHDDVGKRLVDYVDAEFRVTALEWTEGILELIDESHARNIPAALVTASSQRLAAIVVHALDQRLDRTVFRSVVAAEDVAQSKPAPDPYQLAANRLNVAPEDCLAIEDSPTGLASAMRAGCRVIGIEHMTPLDAKGVHVVRSLRGHDLDLLWKLGSQGADSAGLANSDRPS